MNALVKPGLTQPGSRTFDTNETHRRSSPHPSRRSPTSSGSGSSIAAVTGSPRLAHGGGGERKSTQKHVSCVLYLRKHPHDRG